MGRPKGSKNRKTLAKETESAGVNVLAALPDGVDPQFDIASAFTCIQKDFIGIQDLMNSSGLSYDICAKVIRSIKAISDSFGITGYVHRIDYYLFMENVKCAALGRGTK